MDKKILNKLRDLAPNIKKAWTDEARAASADARRSAGKKDSMDAVTGHELLGVRPGRAGEYEYGIYRSPQDKSMRISAMPMGANGQPVGKEALMNGKYKPTEMHLVQQAMDEHARVTAGHVDTNADFIGHGDNGEEIHGDSEGNVTERKPAGRTVVTGRHGDNAKDSYGNDKVQGPHAILPSGRINTTTGKNEYWPDGTNEVWKDPDGNHFVAHTSGDEPLHGVGAKATFKHDQTGRSMRGMSPSTMVGWFHTDPNGKQSGVVPQGSLPVATYK